MAILLSIWANLVVRPFAWVMDWVARALTQRSETETRLLAAMRDAEQRSDLAALATLVTRTEELTWGSQADLAGTLIRMRRRDTNVDGLLRELAEHAGEVARVDALQALSATGDPANADLFTDNLDHPDTSVRFWSAHGLGIIGGLAARPGLNQAASSRDPALRLVAAQTLPIEHPRLRELATDLDRNVARTARTRLQA